jgi:hypothetical protein
MTSRSGFLCPARASLFRGVALREQEACLRTPNETADLQEGLCEQVSFRASHADAIF